MVRPFHAYVDALAVEFGFLALQSIGLNSTCMPRRRLASLAMSIPKPTSSFFVAKAHGRKLSSRPTTTFLGRGRRAGGGRGVVAPPQAASSAVAENSSTAVIFFMDSGPTGARMDNGAAQPQAADSHFIPPGRGAGRSRPRYLILKRLLKNVFLR